MKLFSQITYPRSWCISCAIHMAVFLLLFWSLPQPKRYATSTKQEAQVIRATVLSAEQIKGLTPQKKPLVTTKPRQMVKKKPTIIKKPSQKKIVRKQMPKATLQKKNSPKKRLAQANAQRLRDQARMAKKKAQEARIQALINQQMTKETQEVQAAANQQMAKLIDEYKGPITRKIGQYWIVPPNLAKGVSTLLEIKLGPGGVVLSVKLITKSGNEALDRSAKQAVFKASPLPVPKDQALFDQFRTLRLTVRPQYDNF